jgi:hypothetical protein
MAEPITLTISQDTSSPFVLSSTTSSPFILTGSPSSTVTLQLGATLTGLVDLTGPSSMKGFESYVAGLVNDSELVIVAIAPYAMTINPSNSLAYAVTPPTGVTVFTVKRVRAGVTTTIGSITFIPDENVALINFSDPNLLKNDVVLAFGPSPADATLADTSFLLVQ